MFLEFISNLAVNFRNISCEIQKLPSKKPETILKNQERMKNQLPPVGIELKNPWVEIPCSIHYTIWDLKLFRQKDNISVDSRSRDSKGSCEYSPGKCLKVDKRSEFLRNKETVKFKISEVLNHPK